MSIRIRHINGFGLVALCAARSMPQEGDIYLDDGAHHALAEKFREDFQSEGVEGCEPTAADSKIRAIEESNNPNREWWDKTYAAEVQRC